LSAGRPRVLFIGPLPEDPGGIAQFGRNLGRAMARSHEVEYMGFRRLYPLWSRAGRHWADGVRDDPRRVLVPWMPWSWADAAERMEASRPDLVVFQWWHPLLGPAFHSLATRARAAGSRVVFVCHNSRPHEFFPFTRTLSSLALPSADHLFALSEAVATDLRVLVPGGEPRVLAHPPNLDGVSLMVGPSADGSTSDSSGSPNGHAGPETWRTRLGDLPGPVILFFGHVRRYKGLRDLIHALRDVRRRVPATLVVAGPFFEPPGRYLRVAERFGVGDAVRLFPGYVPDEEVEELFSLADVVALPYRTASQSGIVPLAAAFGRPVVATAVGGIPETMGPNSLVPPRRPDRLAAAIVDALRESPPPPPSPAAGWEDWARAVQEPSPLRTVVPHRSRLVLAGRVAAWSVVAYFVAAVLVSGARGLSRADLSFALWPFLVSTLLVLGARGTDILAWHALVRGTGARIPLHASARVFTTAELMRYLPGGMLHFAARYRLAARMGVRPEAVVATTALDLGLRIGAGLVLVAVAVPFWPNLPWEVVAVSTLAAAALVVTMRPRVLRWLARRVTRLVGSVPSALSLRPASVVAASGWALAGWAMRGGGFYLLGLSLLHVRARLVMPLAGIAALSWVVGVLVPFAGGGLGVREATGASLLGRLVGLAAGVVLMLAARVQSLVIELATMAAAVSWDRLAADRTGQRGGHAVAEQVREDEQAGPPAERELEPS